MIYESGMTDEPPEGCTPKFAPMEWAVLLTDKGGRMFQAETTLWSEMGTERVVEYYVQRGDKKSRFQLYPGSEIGVHVGNLVKIPDKETGEAAVSFLKKENDRSQLHVSRAQSEARSWISAAHNMVRKMVGDPE